MKPRLLDLFCGAGGAAVGYHRAGFEVVGVDIRPQPNYPFEFVQMDALLYVEAGYYTERGFAHRLRDWFDAIHASPPCQAFTNAQVIRGRDHPDLITPTRPLLEATGLPYVIENVPGAPLISPVMICGSMFDPPLDVRRHRLFETNWPLEQTMWPCRHKLWAPRFKISHSSTRGNKRLSRVVSVFGHEHRVDEGRRAMGIDWMTRDELAEAIPPVYTTFIGEQLLSWLHASGRLPDGSSPSRTHGNGASLGHRTGSRLSRDALAGNASFSHLRPGASEQIEPNSLQSERGRDALD